MNDILINSDDNLNLGKPQNRLIDCLIASVVLVVLFEGQAHPLFTTLVS